MSFRNRGMMNVALCGLLGTLMSGACDGDEGGASAEPIALTQLGDRFIATWCEKVFRCCPATARSQSLDLGTDEASCRQTLAPAGAALQSVMSDAVAAGRTAYDAHKMGQCLQDLSAQSCEATRAAHNPIQALASCRAASHGTVSRGGHCAADDDCVDGWCDVNGGFVCTARRATGATCDDDAQCTSGQCDASGGTCITATPDGLCTL